MVTKYMTLVGKYTLKWKNMIANGHHMTLKKENKSNLH